MRLRIVHETRYAYTSPVTHGLQQLRVTPKDRSGQKIVDWNIAVEGARKELHFDDHHHNRVDLISIDARTCTILIRCEGMIDVSDLHGIIGPHTGLLPLWYFLRATELTRAGRRLKSLAREIGGERIAEPIALAHRVSARVRELIDYIPGQTDVGTGAEQALERGHGVCQDHAHAFIAVARLLGYPARYVSGYLMMNDRVEQDATHAWAEAHVEGVGWIGFDVANGHSPDERYVRVATGLDYAEAAPVSGVRIGGAEESLSVSVIVQQQ